MATRRNVNAEKTSLARDDVLAPSSSATPSQRSNTGPAVPTHVIVKLVTATFAMIVLPLGSYFVTLHTLFNGNASYAGGFAALMANVVLISYVIVAMQEDESERLGNSESSGGFGKGPGSEFKKDR